mgnify:CR=1 FL=1
MDVSVVACNKYDEELALNSLRKCLDEIGGLDFDGYGNLVLTRARLKVSLPEAEVKDDEEEELDAVS